MKGIADIKKIYLEDYDVNVNCYLTVEQIQRIVDATKKFNTWEEREQNKNMLVLYFATDVNQEELIQYDYDTLHQSGFVNAVIGEILNYEDIDKALNWTESTQKAISQILKQLAPEINQLKSKVERNVKTNKK